MTCKHLGVGTGFSSARECAEPEGLGWGIRGGRRPWKGAGLTLGQHASCPSGSRDEWFGSSCVRQRGN